MSPRCVHNFTSATRSFFDVIHVAWPFKINPGGKKYPTPCERGDGAS